MRWKKIFITAALLIIFLIVGLYAFLSLYDFNKFKPTIAEAVRNATGRELSIAGDIKFGLGFRPTLIVEEVRFQNASWSSTPDLAQVKRIEVQIAVLPIIFGTFDFAHLVLVEPAIIVEFDKSGKNNFVFETASDPGDESALSPPPIVFSDVLVENGKFTYQDARSDFKFSIRIDRMRAEIPGLDKSIGLDFKGAFEEAPLSLTGMVGPIWAWVESGYALPVDISVTAGGANAHVKGEMRDPKQFKDFAFEFTTQGSSIAEIAAQAGLSNVPSIGAFKASAMVSDSKGSLAVEKLDVNIGSEDLVAISITGDVKNVLELRGIGLDFTARGNDTANLTKIGIPPPPKRDPFQLSGNITDPRTKVFAVEELQVILGDNEIKGQVNLNLAEQMPFLTAVLASQKTMLGPAKLDLRLANLFKKPAVKNLDLRLGTPELAEIRLNGKVDDLLKLQGVGIYFRAKGKNLANLKQLTGQPLPVRGAFNATGKVVIPVHDKIKIPDLKITAGKNNIRCALNLDLSGNQPQLGVELSSQKLDLPSVLVPELAKQGWARGLSKVRPIKLSVKLAGFAQEIALEKVDLLAGNLESAEMRLTGSVDHLPTQRGIDLTFILQGNDIAKLLDIAAQPNLFTPVPGQGAYAISGRVSDPTSNVYAIENFKLSLADTKLSGRLNVNLAGQGPTYEVQLSGPKFNLKPFPIPKEAAYANLNKIDDLGTLKIHSKVVVEGNRLSMPKLDMQAGTDRLASIEVQGSIKNLLEQNGINLDFNIQGNEVATLKEITGQSIPLKGVYGLSGKLADSTPKKYRFSDLKLTLGENNIGGSLDLNLNEKQFGLTADLSAPKFSMQPITLPALEKLASIKDLGPLKLAFKMSSSDNKLPLDQLDFQLGRNDLIEVSLKGTISDLKAVRRMKLDFNAKGNDMSNFKKTRRTGYTF